MNLLQVRQKFLEISGRMDLVNEDGSDNGANFYINEGRKYLDRMNETQKSWASQFRFVDVGRYSASVENCRAIKEVWAASTTSRWQLEKKDLQDLITGFMLGMPSSRTSGTPLYYSPTITRYNPADLQSQNFESFLGWVDVPSGKVEQYNTVIINVPTDTKLVLEIKGLFYSPELSSDTDTNHWSVNHSMLLIMAALRQLEVVNRNTQGVNDWSRAIAEDMTEIGKDLVEELISEITQIED